MQVTFNPKDTNTFASASLDRTVKVWSIGQPTPNFTLEGHEKGVNAVDYFTGGESPYFLSSAKPSCLKANLPMALAAEPHFYTSAQIPQMCLQSPLLAARHGTGLLARSCVLRNSCPCPSCQR